MPRVPCFCLAAVDTSNRCNRLPAAWTAVYIHTQHSYNLSSRYYMYPARSTSVILFTQLNLAVPSTAAAANCLFG